MKLLLMLQKLFGITRGKLDYLKRRLRECCAPNMLPKKGAHRATVKLPLSIFPKPT